MAKIAFITGATDGIGRQTAFELGRLGFDVIVHGRSARKVELTISELSTKAPARYFPAVADLGALEEVRQLAIQLHKDHPVVDVLVNNAGLFADHSEKSRDGFELTFAVNHLAPFLLTHLLLPSLGRSAQGRIVNVSSVAHQRGELLSDNLPAAQELSGYAAYAASKLCNVLFTNALARRLTPPLTINALHPGVISTKLLQKGFGMGGAPLREGALTSVRLASDPELSAVTGRYFSDGRETRSSSKSHDEVLQEALYNYSAELTGVAPLPRR